MPEVLQVIPEDDLLDVPVGTNVTLEFSEPLNPLSVSTATFFLLDPMGAPVPAEVGLAPNGTTVTLDPNPEFRSGGLEFGTVYTVVVTAVPFSSKFATADGPPLGNPLTGVADQTTLPTPPGPGPITGRDTAANLGFSVTSAGLLNNDALGDFLGGAPGYTVDATEEAGAAIVCLGSADPAERIEPEILFYGETAHDRAGAAVAGNFDFNGDGHPDLLIGAEQVDRTQDPPVPVGPGKVYLIYFDPADYDLADPEPDFVHLGRVGNPSHPDGEIPGVVFIGTTLGDQAGLALAGGGPLEASGNFDEITIGAPGLNGGDGGVYVVFSRAGLVGPIGLGDVGGLVDGVVFLGGSGERLGSAVALPGDVIDPPGPDIAMGAPLADTSQVNAGKLYIAAGGGLSPGIINVVSLGTQIHGGEAHEQLGFSVAGAGDSRAVEDPALPDGDRDVLIGAPYFNGEAGRVVHVAGRIPSEVIEADRIGNPDAIGPIDGVIWLGAQELGRLGWSVAGVGDVTGNGLLDVSLGAPFVNLDLDDIGAVYLIEGKAIDAQTPDSGLGGTFDVGLLGLATPGVTYIGTQPSERAGVTTAAAGDLSDDASNDFTVGSPGWDAELGTIHQVLETGLPPHGRCDPFGCTVVDLQTGAQIVVPEGALADTVELDVEGLVELEPPAVPSSCSATSLPQMTLVGVAVFDEENQAFALPTDLDIPTRPEMEYQLTVGLELDLRLCHETFGWTPAGTATVADNKWQPGRKAALADTDELHVYAVFVDDVDEDSASDPCDCDNGDSTIWAPPGLMEDLLLRKDSVSGETVLEWSPPEFPGGTPESIVYDTIRSNTPADFLTGALCLEPNGEDTSSVETQDPPMDTAFYYLVRAENDCPFDPMCWDAGPPLPALECE